MLRWPQYGRSSGTESVGLSGEHGESLLPTTTAKTWRSERSQIAALKQLFGLKKQKWWCTLLLRSWIQLLERLVKPQVLKCLEKRSAKTRVSVKNNLNMWSCSEARVQNFEQFLLLNRFLRLSLNENLLLLTLLTHFCHLVPCIWEF